MTQAPRQFGSPDPIIMGIVNVTPDSFSDGGKFINVNKAVEHGLTLISQGAQILDIGGESTRPGAQAIDIQEEIDRIIPVISELRKHTAHISVDTRNARTMREAIAAGAAYINDISALRHDEGSAEAVKQANLPIILMHMQGAPQDMQENPIYNNVIEDILEFFKERIFFCETQGIEKKNIILDPGIGFGKTLEHNLLILRNIKQFQDLGCEVLLGTSRKRFIAAASQGEPPQSRIGGSLSSVIWGYAEGVRMFRVHDVLETVQALNVYRAILNSGS
jgi:dihydropteroate synthase